MAPTLAQNSGSTVRRAPQLFGLYDRGIAAPLCLTHGVFHPGHIELAPRSECEQTLRRARYKMARGILEDEARPDTPSLLVPSESRSRIGVTAPDAGTGWFMAKAALHWLPPGATLSDQYIEDVDLESLHFSEMPVAAPSAVVGVWFPPGHVRPVQIQIARTPEEVYAGFIRLADDGSAHELTRYEAECLATAFDAVDGARIYVKKRYDSRTPDGRLQGFLRRSELPANVRIHSRDPRDTLRPPSTTGHLLL